MQDIVLYPNGVVEEQDSASLDLITPATQNESQTRPIPPCVKQKRNDLAKVLKANKKDKNETNDWIKVENDRMKKGKSIMEVLNSAPVPVTQPHTTITLSTATFLPYLHQISSSTPKTPPGGIGSYATDQSYFHL